MSALQTASRGLRILLEPSPEVIPDWTGPRPLNGHQNRVGARAGRSVALPGRKFLSRTVPDEILELPRVYECIAGLISLLKMNWESVNWSSLERLRSAFLEGSAGSADYWKTENDLASYDLTFAQRIGWKWDWVLEDLIRLGWQPPEGELLDWGCGTGIAHRAFLYHFGAGSTKRLHLWDRSSLAMRFAANRALEKHPQLDVSTGLCPPPTLLLLSHVLTELSQDQATQLADFAAQADCVIWIEPGTYEASLALIAIRERLRDRLTVVAPCTHQGQCGILAGGNEHHWCHHFANPPNNVFTEGNWVRFGRLMGVDLRSLPLSYLVLDKRPSPVNPDATRIIGRPRLYKPYALALGCDASGVREHRLDKRKFPDPYRQIRKDRFDSLQRWKSEDGVITDLPEQPA